MAIALARTNAEAHLFMELTSCEACGEPEFGPASSVVELPDGGLGSRYTGYCASCGAAREFTFRLPDEPLPLPAEGVRYGGSEPSELLDPGQWLWVADQAAGAVPADPDGLSAGERAELSDLLDVAVACVQEVMKFIPSGAAAVPESAFFSDAGRAIHFVEPGRFDRMRLAAVLAAYRTVRVRFAEA